MGSYTWYRFSYQRSSPASHAGRFTASSRVALAALVALMLLAVGAALAPERARAGSNGPKIVFTSPIYPGQNNGSAEGPVGANVSVQGSGWAADSPVTITLADQQNDTSGQPGSACTNGSPTVAIPGLQPQQPDSGGNFGIPFQWPAAAGTQGHSYWACGTQAGVSQPGVDFYTVLSANPPSAQINVSQAAPGSTITVTGQNWLPGNLPLGIIVAPCVACEPGYSSNAQAVSQPDGSFSAPVQVPTAAPPGTTLYVSVQSTDQNNSGALAVEDPTTAPHFTVVAQQAPTPTHTPTPTPTNAAAATSAANGNGSGTSGNSSGNTVLIVLLAALGVVLLLAAGVAVLFFLRSRTPAPVAPGGPPSGGPGSGYNQYNGPRRTGGSRSSPSYPDTNIDYYGGPPPRSGPPGQAGGWGNAGGWQGNPQEPGPDDGGSGDDPTISMRTPWR
jgi:hypothetical protein